MESYFSYKRLAEINKINGRVLDVARSLQRDIDDTHLAMRNCR